MVIGSAVSKKKKAQREGWACLSRRCDARYPAGGCEFRRRAREVMPAAMRAQVSTSASIHWAFIGPAFKHEADEQAWWERLPPR
jgi:hypothetical protein